MNMYLVPSNSKKQQLIFGFLTKTDLIVLIIGAFITFTLLVALPVGEVWAVIIILLPAFVTAFLIFPIPNYHNSRILVTELYLYYSNRKKYIWRGWCYTYDEDGPKRQ